MITTTLLYLLYGVIRILLLPFNLLPNAVLNASITTSLATAGTYIKSMDFIFPTSSFLTILGLIFGIEIVILTYKLIMWVIRKIPTIN
jgi:hypothetical protein